MILFSSFSGIKPTIMSYSQRSSIQKNSYSKTSNSQEEPSTQLKNLPAVSAVQLQDAKLPEEELEKKAGLQLKSIVQKAEPGKQGPDEELDASAVPQLKSVVQKAGTEEKKEDEPAQLKANNTGMPDQLKSGIENLSGMDMSDVKVHYNSSQPAQLNALAYAQGNDIHIGAGQEKHLAHEAWHVVQQRQGRVQATTQLKAGVAVNDDPGLEHEADVMGAKALQMKSEVDNSKKISL